MLDAGVMRGGNALKPGYSATTVRLRDGRREVWCAVQGPVDFGKTGPI